MSEQKKIILVDDDATNLINGKNALANEYEVYTVPSGEKLFKMLEKITPDLILLDIEMPEMNGYEVIEVLKNDPKTARYPVIFLTARSDTGSEFQGLSLGAVDFITKPFVPPLLQKRVENHLLLKEYGDNLEKLVETKTKTVSELQTAIFNILARIVEYRDDETGGHVMRTQRYLRVLLEAMQVENVYHDEIASWDTRLLVLSSQLHDIGKIAIPDSILLKPAKLTPEEFEMMKSHAAIGERIISSIEAEMAEHLFIQYAKLMAASHHEKYDGSGYPNKLTGDMIPLQGRLMAIVDVYDALVSERPYKIPFTHEKALSIIAEGRGTHFDPNVADVFLAVGNKIEEAKNAGG